MPNEITKFINSLTSKTRARLKKKLIELKINPFRHKDIKKLAGAENLYRFRIGKIRVIFQFKNGVIEIIDIDYRGNIY